LIILLQYFIKPFKFKKKKNYLFWIADNIISGGFSPNVSLIFFNNGSDSFNTFSPNALIVYETLLSE
jgi:hypothetical protein